jgi:signal transduction histidine kinase
MTGRIFAGKRLGVRARTTMVATVVVGLVLIGSGVLLVLGTRSALFRAIETTVTARSQDIATQLVSGAAPDVVPLVGGISVQILSGASVVASTLDIEGQGPILDAAALPTAHTAVQVPSLDAQQNEGGGESNDDSEGPFLVSISLAEGNGASATVLAAASLATIDDTTQTMVPLLALGTPAVVGLVGLLVWRLTRRAFLPVEAMARRADAISYSDLHLRIPEPEADDEIRHLSVVLNRMLERVQSSALRQRRFTSDAGHELKSPVATLLTMAEVAARNPGDFEVSELAGDFAGQARRLADVVEDLLLLARTDEHRLDLDSEPFDLAACVKREVAAVGTVPVSIDVEEVRPACLRGDEKRMGQVVRNLLDNAVRHADGEIRVATQMSGSMAVLSVADDGAGIPDNDRERVFERFVRLDEARSRDSGGTGLGLAVVKSIVEAHGGSIEVGRDRALGGASITVFLPVDGGRSEI